MSPQALVLLVVYIIFFVVGLIMSIKAKTFGMNTVFGLFGSILFLCLTVYDTNCLTAGNCGVWSWIRTILYVLIPLIALVIMFVSFFKGKDITKKTEEEVKH